MNDEDRPIEPPVLTGVEVVWNPFDDIVPRKSAAAAEKEKQEAAKWVQLEPCADGCIVCTTMSPQPCDYGFERTVKGQRARERGQVLSVCHPAV